MTPLLRLSLACFAALVALTALAADGQKSRVFMLIRSGRTTKTVEVKSAAFDHAKVGKLHLGAPLPTVPNEVTVVIVQNAANQQAFKAGAKFRRIDLLLYVTPSTGRQHLRSQLEIGDAKVAAYKVAEDRKTATVTLSSAKTYLSETVTSANPDWVTSE